MFQIPITARCQNLIAPLIQKGDLVVDATLGKGQDTLFLTNQVGPKGLVLAFDIQEAALEQTRALFQKQQGSIPENVRLLCTSHENLQDHLPASPRAIMFNLGYLPGGDKSLTTHAQSTIIAIKASLNSLMTGGVLSVIAYPGHDGGKEEHESVKALLTGLESQVYEVLTITQTNRSPWSPVLYLIYKN